MFIYLVVRNERVKSRIVTELLRVANDAGESSPLAKSENACRVLLLPAHGVIRPFVVRQSMSIRAINMFYSISWFDAIDLVWAREAVATAATDSR